jgi:hypothetical protein
MPDTDLDAELTRLRDEVRDSLAVPEFRQVVARHKQRVVRRRMQVGAAVAVLVVSVAIPLLRNQMASDRVRPATPPPASDYSPPKGPFISAIDYADDDHGYVIRARCKGGPVTCTEQLLATDDGGKHWEKRSLPRPDSAPTWTLGTLHLTGSEEVTVDWPTSASDESTRTYRAHSVDGGRTWQSVPVPGIVTDTVPAIPPDGVLVPSCARLSGGGYHCAERGFAVLLPGSGRSAKLANSPRLTAMIAGEIPMSRGRWWVIGREPKTDHWGIAISDDDGRSWRTTILDWGDNVDPFGWSVVAQGDAMYATAIGTLPDVSNGLLGIFRSTDGGQSWAQTWQPKEGKQPRRVFPSTVAGADGTLTINSTDGKMFLSRDGGRTFTETKQRYTDYAGRLRTGYIAGLDQSPLEMATSSDGVHWRKVKVD